jgi:hypothetical protein
MKKTFITTVFVVALLGVGGVLLHARLQPTPVTPQSVNHDGQTGSSLQPETGGVQPFVSSTHIIDTAGVAPSEIVAGTAQALTFSAVISDPAVIASSVNIVETKADGSQAVLGTLHPTGNGNFALVTTPQELQLATGTLTLRISAAFSGGLRRVQTPGFSLLVDPATNTSEWTSVSPSGLFAINLPPEMHIAGDSLSGGGYDTNTFDILLSDGTTMAWVFVFTPQQWAAAQQTGSDDGGAALLSSGPTYILGYSLSENDTNTLGLDEATLQSELTQALASARAY